MTDLSLLGDADASLYLVLSLASTTRIALRGGNEALAHAAFEALLNHEPDAPDADRRRIAERAKAAQVRDLTRLYAIHFPEFEEFATC